MKYFLAAVVSALVLGLASPGAIPSAAISDHEQDILNTGNKDTLVFSHVVSNTLY